MLNRLEYFFVRLLYIILYLLPFSIASRIGMGLGWLWFLLHKKRRNIAIENLKIAFGNEKDIREIKDIAKSSFQNMGLTLVEFFLSKKYGKEWSKKNIEFAGYDDAFREYKKGKNCLILTAHFGNWELMGIMASLKGTPINVVARPIDNPLIDKMINDLRSFYGNKVISKHRALRGILKVLKNKEPVAILLDQNTSPLEGIFVDFFGKPACTTPSLAILALRTGLPVYPSFLIRKGPGIHKFVIGPRIVLDVSDNIQRDIERNTAKFTKIIESYVRQYPENWLWMHRRWKTQRQNGKVI